MAKLEYSGFRGILPRQNPTLLPKAAAQEARNAALWHGDMRPLKAPSLVKTLPAIGREIKTIYRLGQDMGEDNYWLTWGTDVDVVRGIVTDDTDERTFFTGDGRPKWTTIPMATQGGASFPVLSRTLGVPRPVKAPQMLASVGMGSISPSGANISTDVAETRVYVYTFVNDRGEEGPPSPPGIVQCGVQQGCWLGNTDAAGPAGDWNIVAKRLYRGVTTGAGTGSYFFEREMAMNEATHALNNGTDLSDAVATNTAYASIAQTAQLSEELITQDFDPPPENLQGLIALPGGVLAGFHGYDLYFSEPGYPYAWPAKYGLTVDYPIVGLGVYGSTLVVMTKGIPYLVNGSDPSSYSMDKVALDQACVSKRSICSVGNGVVYACPDGLAYVGAGVPTLLTESHFTQPEWRALPIASMRGYYTDGKYICVHDAGAFVINSLEDKELVNLDLSASCGYVDLRTDSLYLCQGANLLKYNGGANLVARWRGKKEQANGRPGPKCGKVQADSWPVTFRLFADGVLKHEQAITSSNVFRLPAGYRAQQLELEVETSAGPVLAFGVADSPEEFKNG